MCDQQLLVLRDLHAGPVRVQPPVLHRQPRSFELAHLRTALWSNPDARLMPFVRMDSE